MKVRAYNDEWYPVLSLEEDEGGIYEVPDGLYYEYKEAVKNFGRIMTKLLGIIEPQGFIR